MSDADVMLRHQNREKLSCPPDCPAGMYDIMLACWRLDVNTRATGAALRHRIEDYLSRCLLCGSATTLSDWRDMHWVMDGAGVDGVQ